MKISAHSDLKFLALVAVGEEGKWAWKCALSRPWNLKGQGKKHIKTY